MALGRGGLEVIGAEVVIVNAQKAINDLTNLEKGFRNVNTAVGDLEKAGDPLRKTFAAIGVGSAAIAAGLGAIAGATGAIGIAAGRSAADFEQSLGTVAAITRGTTEQLSRLEQTIREISSTSITGLTDAAFAAGELAKAGVSIEDQIGGALEAVNNLTIASAGELGLERAALLVGSALQAFNLSGDQAARVANALTSAAQQSAISFVDLQRSFQQAAPVASILGLTVEDLAAALGVLGEQGIRGSDAGTSLKQAFIQLAKPSKDALEQMREYGISLFDATGRARPFRDVIIDLEQNFGDAAIASGRITEAQRAFAVATIFGSDAIRAAIVSAVRGVESFDKFTDATKDSSFSAETLAKIIQQPLNAQIQIFSNNIADLASRVGRGFLDFLKQAVVDATQLARSLKPAADAIGALIAATLGGGFADEDLRAKLEKAFDPRIADGLLNTFQSLSGSVQAIGEAFSDLGTQIRAALSEDEQTQLFADGLNAIATAVRGAATGIIVLTSAAGGLITILAENEELVAALGSALVTIGSRVVIGGLIAVGAAATAMAAAFIAANGPILAVAAAAAGLSIAMNRAQQSINEVAETPPIEVEVEADTEEVEELPNQIAQIAGDVPEIEIDTDIDTAAIQDGLEDTVTATEVAFEAANDLAVIRPSLDPSSFFFGLSSVIDQFGIFLHSVNQGFSDSIALVLNGAKDAVAEFIAVLGRGLTNIADFGVKAAKVIGDAFGQTFSAISTGLLNLSLDIRGAEISVPVGDEGSQQFLAEVSAGLRTVGATLRDFGDRAQVTSDRVRNAIDNITASFRGTREESERTLPGLNHFGDGAEKAGRKAKEAGPAIDGFADALAKAIRLQSFIERFGDVGAQAVDDLINAIVSNIDKDGAKAAESLHKFAQLLRKENIPDFQELGDAAMEAFRVAIIERSDSAIQAAIDVIARAADAIKAQGALTLSTFAAAFNLGAVKTALGNDGAKLMDDLKKAIVEGGTDAVRAVGSTAAEIVARFRKDFPPDIAREATSQFMAAIRRAIEDGTPDAISALQSTIRRLNFETQFAKLARETSTAINVLLEDAFNELVKLARKADADVAKIFADSQMAEAIAAEREGIQREIRVALDAFKDLQEARSDEIRRNREQRDLEIQRTREDADLIEERGRLLAEARKRAEEKSRQIQSNPAGFTRLAAADEEISKLKARFALEDQELAKRRSRENEDRARREGDRIADKAFRDGQTIDLDLQRQLLERQLEAFERRLTSQRLEAQAAEIRNQAEESRVRIQEQLDIGIGRQNEKFEEQHQLLLDMQTLADAVFDGMLDDTTKILKNVKDVKIEQGLPLLTEGLDLDLPEFIGGGTVPGPLGRPRLILAHGGEEIIPTQVTRAEAAGVTNQVFHGPTTSNVTYQVNANYEQVQSPDSISDDMIALMMLAQK